MGGIAAQVATSIGSYAYMCVASFWDDDIRSDMNAIGWNPFNSNANDVINSNKVSFYKGVPVYIKNSGRPWFFYAISLNKNNGIDELKHERGHNWQAMMMGMGSYGLAIGLPSAGEWRSSKWSDYYNSPWEITADLLGGANNAMRTRSEINRGWLHLGVSIAFWPASYLFLI